MLLIPGASDAVEKAAVPLLSGVVSRTLPLLTSVNVTEPAGTPPLARTRAVNVTHESCETDVDEAASAVLVGTATAGYAAAAAPGKTAAPDPATTKMQKTTRGQRITPASPK